MAASHNKIRLLDKLRVNPVLSKAMQNKPDRVLFITSAILVVWGVIILASISAPISQKSFDKSTYFLTHQLIFGLIPGILLGLMAYSLPLSVIKKWAPALMLVNLIFLILVFTPGVGQAFGGAARWINLGLFSFQPSEFLKISFILYLAGWLDTKHNSFLPQVNSFKFSFLKRKSLFSAKNSLIPFLAIIGLISLLLILQPDISTLAIIVLIGVLMYFSTQTPLWHNILLLLMGVGGITLLIKTAPYRIARWLVFLKPETDPLGIGYQLKQSLIAIGSGGIFGIGLGMSGQKFGFLPHPMSDSVFAIISEETGFIGSLVLISLFLVLAWRGFKISKKSQSTFAHLVSFGISSWIIIQSLINMGSMIGVLPLTGIPLPFLSYGGSHLVVELIGIGILLNISKQK